MKIKFYKNIHSKETVYEEEKELFALSKLGIIITPQNQDGTLSEEQNQFIKEFTDWYFSDNWIEEWEDVD